MSCGQRCHRCSSLRAVKGVPHSVAKGPPEWSHETEGEWVSMRPTGALPFQEDWKGPPHRRETSITTLPTYEVLSSLCPEFPWDNFGGFGSYSSLEAESIPRDGNPSPNTNCRKRRIRQQGGRHKVNMTCRQRCHRCSNLRAVKGVNDAMHLTAHRRKIPRKTRSTMPVRCERRRAMGSTSCTWRRRPSC